MPMSSFPHRAPSLFETVKFKILKSVTLAVFFCLPRKLTNVFVSLSIVSMVLKLRDRNLQSERTLLTRIESLLKINLSENILVLPNQTVTWFWSQRVLASQVQINGKFYSLEELLLNPDSFLSNRNLVLDVLLDKLPLSVRYKLKLFDVENRIAVKHNIVSALMYA